MFAELIPLPNKNSKILKANFKQPENIIFAPFFKNETLNPLNLAKKFHLKTEEIDVLILILHLYFTHREKDNLLYFNTDDILILRGVQKNKNSKNGKTGYKKEVRQRIAKCIMKLSKLSLFTIIDYNDFNFVLCMNSFEVKDFIPIKRTIFTLNPIKESWHKRSLLFFYYLAKKKEAPCFCIQVKKIFENFEANKLKPYKTRERFENALDKLCLKGVIKNWHYAKIDENLLDCKSWINKWMGLSIKISV